MMMPHKLILFPKLAIDVKSFVSFFEVLESDALDEMMDDALYRGFITNDFRVSGVGT